MMIGNLLTFLQIWARPLCAFLQLDTPSIYFGSVRHALWVTQFGYSLGDPNHWDLFRNTWSHLGEDMSGYVMSCWCVIPPFTRFFIIWWPHESFSLLWLPENIKTTKTQKICDQAAIKTAKYKLAEVCFKGVFLHNTAELSPSKGLGRNLDSNHFVWTARITRSSAGTNIFHVISYQNCTRWWEMTYFWSQLIKNLSWTLDSSIMHIFQTTAKERLSSKSSLEDMRIHIEDFRGGGQEKHKKRIGRKNIKIKVNFINLNVLHHVIHLKLWSFFLYLCEKGS